jgi:hypothetical protein
MRRIAAVLSILRAAETAPARRNSAIPAEHCVDGAEQRFPRRALVEGNYWLQGDCSKALVEDKVHTGSVYLFARID